MCIQVSMALSIQAIIFSSLLSYRRYLPAITVSDSCPTSIAKTRQPDRRMDVWWTAAALGAGFWIVLGSGQKGQCQRWKFLHTLSPKFTLCIFYETLVLPKRTQQAQVCRQFIYWEDAQPQKNTIVTSKRIPFGSNARLLPVVPSAGAYRATSVHRLHTGYF